MKIEKFEDLNIWKDAREICKLINKITLNDKLTNDFRFVNQIKSSAGSVMDNIACPVK